MTIPWPGIKTSGQLGQAAREMLAKYYPTFTTTSVLVSLAAGEPLVAASDRGFFHCYGSFVSFTINGHEAAVYEVVKKVETHDFRVGHCYEIHLVKVEERLAQGQLVMQARFAESGTLSRSLPRT